MIFTDSDKSRIVNDLGSIELQPASVSESFADDGRASLFTIVGAHGGTLSISPDDSKVAVAQGAGSYDIERVSALGLDGFDSYLDFASVDALGADETLESAGIWSPGSQGKVIATGTEEVPRPIANSYFALTGERIRFNVAGEPFAWNAGAYPTRPAAACESPTN